MDERRECADVEARGPACAGMTVTAGAGGSWT